MPSATETPTPTVADLVARLEAGDDAVTADDLLRAEAEERFGRARAAAAAKRAADEAEAARRGRIAAFRAALPSRLDGRAVEKARDRLAAAVDAYLDACRAHDDATEAAIEELRGMGPLPAGLAVDAPRFGRITDGGAEYRGARPQVTIAGIVTEAIVARYPRRGVNLNAPQD